MSVAEGSSTAYLPNQLSSTPCGWPQFPGGRQRSGDGGGGNEVVRDLTWKNKQRIIRRRTAAVYRCATVNSTLGNVVDKGEGYVVDDIRFRRAR